MADLEKQLKKEISRRKTFAIISHPDAGKTTLTEKLLLYGGAIHLAGAVKAKKNDRHTTSDWQELERQRGISISTTVLQFDYREYRINLLDTPGHKDFSEDTYRTLMAVDAAVMLIDAAKGVEPQTRKLFEVCRMRGIPIFTFINKLDRPARELLDLIDELEKLLGIRSSPINWPIGTGDRFQGIYDRLTNNFLLFEKPKEANLKTALQHFQSCQCTGVEDPKLLEFLQSKNNPSKSDEIEELYEQFKAESELLEVAGDPFEKDRILSGELTPVFFGSALNNYGVQNFLDHFLQIAPSPSSREIQSGEEISPDSKEFSSFIFKIQANMDLKHRDRVVFFRVCSGKMNRNQSVYHTRLNRKTKLTMPLHFFGQDREIIEEAWPGDIVGLLDTSGQLRIGDTLSDLNTIEYHRVPSFSPEHFGQVTIQNPMKRKQLKKGLDQLNEEGVIQVFHEKDMGDKDPILGAVGALQFEVLKHRLQSEYSVDARIDRLPFQLARWLSGSDLKLQEFNERQDSKLVFDRDENPIVLFKNEWSLNWATDHYRETEFLLTPPMKRAHST